MKRAKKEAKTSGEDLKCCMLDLKDPEFEIISFSKNKKLSSFIFISDSVKQKSGRIIKF